MRDRGPTDRVGRLNFFRLRLRLGVVARVELDGAAAPTGPPAGCGTGFGARPRRARPELWVRSARGWRGQGTATPLVQAGGTPLGQRPLRR